MISLTQEEYEEDLEDARREGYNQAVEACAEYAIKLIDDEYFDMSDILKLRWEVSDGKHD